MGNNVLPALFGLILLAVFGIAQAFFGYRLWRFFRIFSGLLAGFLISTATGFLYLMDGTRGDVIRFMINASDNSANGIIEVVEFIIKTAINYSEETGQWLQWIDSTGMLDSIKTVFMIGVLVCILCAVASAINEKLGVFLELFAYGYAPIALYFAIKDSTLLGAILGIAVGAVLGFLCSRISRVWIIISTSVLGGLMVPMVILNLIVIIGGLYVQFKITGVPRDSAAARPNPAPMWPPAAPPAPPRPTPPPVTGAPPAGKQRFCTKCGTPLASDARFCTKCGTSARDK